MEVSLWFASSCSYIARRLAELVPGFLGHMEEVAGRHDAVEWFLKKEDFPRTSVYPQKQQRSEFFLSSPIPLTFICIHKSYMFSSLLLFSAWLCQSLLLFRP